MRARKRRSVLLIAWAFPWTAVGLALGLLGLPFGGQYVIRSGVIEFYGGPVSWMLERLPLRPFAMTLGHCIWGRTKPALDFSHDHELVHVRQYERWGILFVPAYLLASVWVWSQGLDAYRDNPFEREAYAND